jgi:SAM-dependent methyltransferase
MQDQALTAANFLIKTLDFYGVGRSAGPVLDFGCGAGGLVKEFGEAGFSAHGCDVSPYWEANSDLKSKDCFKIISRTPYKLPYPDAYFSAVISTSVLEHCLTTEESFMEIKRVLKPSGISLHLYPGKWYLPYEPHIYVPLLNFFYPYIPKWCLWIFALLGVRNEFQEGLTAAETVKANLVFCETRMIYKTKRAYKRLSLKIFGNCEFPMRLYIDHAAGGYPKLARRLPFRGVTGWLSAQIRMAVIVQRKK